MSVILDGERPANRSERRLRQFLLWSGLVALIAMLPFLSGLIGAVMLYVITRRLHAALSRVVPPRVSAASLALQRWAVRR